MYAHVYLVHGLVGSWCVLICSRSYFFLSTSHNQVVHILSIQVFTIWFMFFNTFRVIFKLIFNVQTNDRSIKRAKKILRNMPRRQKFNSSYMLLRNMNDKMSFYLTWHASHHWNLIRFSLDRRWVYFGRLKTMTTAIVIK